MSTIRKTSKTSRLEHIETKLFESGNTLVETFENDKSYPAIRYAVQCYRASMQAMRDQIKYTAKK